MRRLFQASLLELLMTRKLPALAAVILACGALSLGACNTMKGAGRDVAATGHAVTNAAQDTQNSMDGNNSTSTTTTTTTTH